MKFCVVFITKKDQFYYFNSEFSLINFRDALQKIEEIVSLNYADLAAVEIRFGFSAEGRITWYPFSKTNVFEPQPQSSVYPKKKNKTKKGYKRKR